MNQIRNSHSLATPRCPDMPRRQGWNTDDILCMGNDYTYADAATEIFFLWNEWADSVETILYGLVDQIEELDVSYDDYLNLVRQFTSYPTRPLLPAADSPTISDSLLSGVWNEWADVVERIVDDVKGAIDRSVPLPREEQTMCAGGLVNFSPDPSNQDLPMLVAARLRKMLRDGTVARDEMIDFMGSLSLQQ